MRVLCAAASAAALAGLRGVAGLFEDEVGQHEWVLRQIGMPTSLAYSSEGSAERVFVASASGVVAAVALKDGQMQWRRIATTTGGVRVLRAAGRSLVSVADGGLVQSWKTSGGDLSWQREYASPVIDVLVTGAGKTQHVVVLRDSELESRTLSAGSHEWSAAVAESMKTSDAAAPRFWAMAAAADEGQLCVVGSTSDGTAVTLRVNGATGEILGREDLPQGAHQGLRRGAFVMTDTHMVFLLKDRMRAVPICGGELAEFELSKVKGAEAGARLLPWQRTHGVFALGVGGASTAVFGLGAGGLKLLRTFEGAAVVGPVLSAHEDEVGQPVAVATTEPSGMQIQLMDPASGNAQPTVQAAGYSSSEHGPVRLLLVHELSSGEHRIVISAADHSFAGVQGGRVMWVREEALASIHQAAFYSRTAAASAADRLAEPEAEEVGGIAALTAQLAALPGHLAKEPADLMAAFATWVTPRKRAAQRKMVLMPDAVVPSASEELRDFGADKLVIVATKASKLFAIEATTSEIVWTEYIDVPAGSCEAGATCAPTMTLLPSAAAPASELLVLAPAAGGMSAMWLEPLTGKALHKELVPTSSANLAAVTPLLPRGKHHLHGLHAAHAPVHPCLVIDAAHGVHVLPSKSAEVQQLAAETADTLFHYEVDTSEQVVQGFALSKNEQGHADKLLRLWNLELGGVGEKVLAAVVPEHREWDHVPVHIKGDATILYKYINKNLLAVATEDSRGNATFLNLYVVDSVTGHVLHQGHIAGGSGPVHLVACDNWVIMHYRNPKRTRFEITVVELFQAKADDGPWDIIFGGGHGANVTKSAHHLDMPVPLQQTYIFPTGVSAIGVTATLKGITPRSIIMALTTDHVFTLPKDLLNPRRPYPQVGAVAAGAKKKSSVPAQFAPTKEEALPPYVALLPVKPTDILTHSHSTSLIEGIISSPSALESTSLVFGYGLDVFFTPVQSAKAYDVLSPGFNYVFLYLSVGVVLVSWAITSVVASKRALQDRWK